MKKVWIYVLITFALTWTIDGIIAIFVYDINFAQFGQLAVAFTMFMPMIGAFITNKIIGKEEKIDLRLRPKLKGNIKEYLLAWFGPAIFTAVGAVVFFLINPEMFSPTFEAFRIAMKPALDAGTITPDLISVVLISQVVSAVLIAPFFNMIFGFGEEVGWRGFLFPALSKKLSSTKTILISGVIWGLWHAPITALGHNYGLNYQGYPWTGILAMCIFCIFIGCFLAYLTEKTESIWPAALSHGALNAISGLGYYFTPDMNLPNRFLGPAPTGIIGGIGFIIVGICCFIWFRKRETTEVNNGN